VPSEFEKKFNDSLDKLLGDIVASRSIWAVLIGVWLCKVDPILSGICIGAGLVIMAYDTQKMERK
jgi:hypothetical protein